MPKTLFGLQGAQLFVTCTAINVRKFEPKGKSPEQLIDLKLETLVTPDRMNDSPFLESAFEVTPIPKGKQETIKGAGPAPKAKYQARPGAKVTIGQAYKDFSLIMNNDNDPDLMEKVNESSMEPVGDKGLRLWPKHGVTLKEIDLDTDKSTGSPTAKLIFMVKGLPSTSGSIPWLEFEQFVLEGVIKTETEVNAEVAEKKAAKSAPGQETIEEPDTE